MIAKIRKYHQSLIILLITVCMGIIIIGGVQYVRKLRSGLRDNAVQNLMTVTVQQQQSFDSFIEKDQEQVHAFAEFFPATASAPRRRSGIC